MIQDTGNRRWGNRRLNPALGEGAIGRGPLTPGNRISGHWPKITLVGPSSSGKTSSIPPLVELVEQEFGVKPDLGEKYKARKDFVVMPEDGKSKDSKPIRSQAQLDRLRASGRVALEYIAAGTRYLPTIEDAKRTDAPVIYISNSNDGARAYLSNFNDIVVFFLYTHLEVLAQRLHATPMDSDERERRLATYQTELAGFNENAHQFHFPLYTTVDFLDLASLDPNERRSVEITGRIRTMVKLLKTYIHYHTPGMDVKELHKAFINDMAQRFLGLPLVNLEARLRSESPLLIDLSDIASEHDIYIPDHFGGTQAEVLAYVVENGRHTVFLKGKANRDSSGEGNPYDESILELIERKLGVPGKKGQSMEHQDFVNWLDPSLLRVDNAVARTGLQYSLGDGTFANLDAHPALQIALLYPNGDSPKFIGYTLTKIAERQSNYKIHPSSPNIMIPGNGR